MSAPADRLRVASYNIRRCKGPGWPSRERPDRIAGVLRQIDADLVGLQEVATGPGDVDGHLWEIAAAAGYKALPGANLRDDRGAYGNALLTRLPLERRVHHRLGSFEGREPRGALDVVARVGGAPLRVVVTHFGLRGRERAHQAERLLAALRWRPAELPVLLLGDWNDPLGRGAGLRRVREAFAEEAAPRSFPAAIPLLRLDRLFTRPAGLLRSAHAHRSRLARYASDHLPLVAELDPARLAASDEGLSGAAAADPGALRGESLAEREGRAV